MLDTDDNVQRLLAAAVSDQPPGIDLLAGVRKRQAARRTRTRAALAAGAVALIAVAATVAGTVHQNSQGTHISPAVAAVTAAADRTAADSYLFTATYTLKYPPQARLGTANNIYYGIFDPARRIGGVIYSNSAAKPVPVFGADIQKYDVLQIGSYLYNHDIQPSSTPKSSPSYNKSWLKAPVGGSGSFHPTLLGPGGWVMGIPGYAFALLQSVHHLREVGPVSGPGWTGTRYAFALKSLGREGPLAYGTPVGAVDIDRHGRVRAVEETLVTTYFPESGSAPEIEHETVTVTFGHFGVTVPALTVPPASQQFTLGPPAHRPSPSPGRSSAG